MDRFRTRLKSLEVDARTMGLEFTAYLLGVVALSLDEQGANDDDSEGAGPDSS